ncbi:Haloacid dehalogenase domain protein hydrolase [Ferrimonas balearica DSM 9799]|uniref:phosphoglycolate phosphatase n=1 Tax=Ferrimonas balearica (strain DSM 9799 / CCM 4581 / KCTC 23876 / PAT) TaxID=550540 RepID=E1SNA9_FERBD|nr:HAD hydrolase-like protein [Ferrimonas balearica]ADN74608.1 Haloacid dehalogenase domain protein hydrolase [Ferrimonas balearica DSM 9799]MBW3140421.1 HAD hydrolase-like protein [Ferrimonas balearica]MBW3165586.1 HAD hydrolase-like protein [Ferrimonas balearica]MBY6107764.1 HAD hydrolase-like protein [Ferrimonas balearica]MBY6225771.1 HAD hydrolase-like protein [Ferrimonas balearica]
MTHCAPESLPTQLLARLAGYRQVIWDWNGTLVNDAPLATDIVNAMLSEHQLPATALDHYRDTFCHPVEAYYQRIGLTEKLSFDVICQRFGQDYRAARDRLNLHPGARPLLHALSQTHTQSLLSASSQSSLEHCLDHHRISTCFHHVYGLDNHHAACKIDRGHELLKAAGVRASDTVMIGDTDHDHEVAEALGIDLILIADGHQSHASLSQLGAELYPGWDALR